MTYENNFETENSLNSRFDQQNIKLILGVTNNNTD
jgi:hypothetical protein